MSSAGPSRVLLCDDSAELRLIVRSALERDGDLLVVGEAGDGPSSVRLAAEARPDAIVLDLTMPGLDPEALVPAVRRSAPEAGLIVFSGVAPDETERLIGGLADTAHVPKTAPPGRLLAAVRAAVAI